MQYKRLYIHVQYEATQPCNNCTIVISIN